MSEMNAAFDVGNLLKDASFGALGGYGDWAINIDKEPATPDKTITIYNTMGRDPDPKWRLNFPEVQVRVRGGAETGRQAAHDVARRVLNKLNGILPFVGNSGTKYQGVWAMGDVLFLMTDDNNRAIYVVNFRMQAEPVTDDNRSPL